MPNATPRKNHRPRAGGDQPEVADRTAYWRQQLLAMPRFETVESATEEDRRRLERAGWVLPIVPPLGWLNLGPKLKLARYGRPLRPAVHIARDDLLPLMEKWRQGILGEVAPTTSA